MQKKQTKKVRTKLQDDLNYLLLVLSDYALNDEIRDIKYDFLSIAFRELRASASWENMSPCRRERLIEHWNNLDFLMQTVEDFARTHGQVRLGKLEVTEPQD